MSILHDPAAPVVFTPSSEERKPEAARIVYYLKVPTVADKPAYRHAVIVAGGRTYRDIEMFAAQLVELAAIMCDPADAEQLAELKAVIEARMEAIVEYSARYQAGEFETDAELVAAHAELLGAPDPRLGEIERAVMAGSAKYAGMCADRTVYPEIAGIVAARMFLTGWDNIDAAFKRRFGAQVGDDMLQHVEAAHLIEIGRKIGSLIDVTSAKRKNSQSPPSTGSEVATSTAGSTPHPKRRSKATSGNTKP